MVAVSQNKPMTVDEFEAFCDTPENVDRLLELIDGEVFEKMPTERHAAIAARITIRIGIFIEQNDLGRITVEPRHRAPNDDRNSRLPDVAFTSKERALPIADKGSVPQLPDLAVEIKSPSDSNIKLRAKADFYLKNGVRMVWLVYPEQQLVEIYQPDVDLQILTAENIIEGGAVLPNFQLKVKDIFDI